MESPLWRVSAPAPTHPCCPSPAVQASIPSICIAPYPKPEESWRDEGIEADMAYMQVRNVTPPLPWCSASCRDGWS